MFASRYFQELKNHIDKAALVPSFKREVQSSLQYFIVQSELSIEERAHPRELRKEWILLTQKTQGLKLFEKFEKEDMLWRTIKCFVHAEDPATLLIPKSEIPKPESPYKNWDPIKYFEYAVSEVRSRPQLTPYENLILTMGLYFLENEAIQGRGTRKPARIQETWKNIEPLLKKLGMLKPLAEDRRLADQMKFFITNSL